MIENDKSLNIEVEMLKGNINRMCVTDNLEELLNMKHTAQKRIDNISDYLRSKFYKE